MCMGSFGFDSRLARSQDLVYGIQRFTGDEDPIIVRTVLAKYRSSTVIWYEHDQYITPRAPDLASGFRDSPRIVPARLFRHDLVPPTIRLEVKPLASSPFGKGMFSGASPLSRVGEYYGRLVERERRCRGGHGEVRTFFRLLVLFRPI
jgi:hypothetical protein